MTLGPFLAEKVINFTIYVYAGIIEKRNAIQGRCPFQSTAVGVQKTASNKTSSLAHIYTRMHISKIPRARDD